MHIHYDLHGHALAQEPPAPGIMKFTVSVDSFLVIITIYLQCLGVEKKIFEEMVHLH